jgi:alkanesulfonate monooxygenase SsuD/methylene tetrahydromethanopterin reductase-like flavin-dependent oxidoreductase (luciferase family)
VCEGDAGARIADLLAQADAAAAGGFDGVTLSEHHLGFPGYYPNPLQAATWILERTRDLWVAPAPMLPLLRPPRLVVEELAWLAARHPRRVGAGFAAGSIAADFSLAGTDQRDLTARFAATLAELGALLGGDVPDDLCADPAIAALRHAPIPVVSAASSHTACRRAAALGVGVLLESAVSPAEITRLVASYRSSGGTGPVVLVRRVWIGDDPPVELERKRDDLVRSTVPVYNRASWMPPEQMILHGDHAAVVEALRALVEETGVTALNLRVHVPGLSADATLAQVRLVAEVLDPLRQAFSR